MLQALAFSGSSPNGGNGVTQRVKWAVKNHRARGVHVTPTVFVNGVEAVEVSSSWGLEEWCAFLEPYVSST